MNLLRPSLISSSVIFFFCDLGRLWMASGAGSWSLSLSMVTLLIPSTISSVPYKGKTNIPLLRDVCNYRIMYVIMISNHYGVKRTTV